MRVERNHTDAMRGKGQVNFDEEFITDKYRNEFPHILRDSEEREPAIYVMSAITSNKTDYVRFSRVIKLNAWIDTVHQKKRIKCCLLRIDNTISDFKNPMILQGTSGRLVASQITCPFNKLLPDVCGVTLQFANYSCPGPENDIYMKPYHPRKENDEEAFAVCLKIVYGNVDNTLFIDWLEFLREMKIDKIFMTSYNITEATDSVIRHYVKIGFVERRYFDYPGKSQFRDISAKNQVVWQIIRAITYDCLARSSGYKFMAILDMDEFLLPRKHGNVKELMKYLMKTVPNAAGFSLPSFLFVKDVAPDPTARINGSDVVKYFWRTPALAAEIARGKNIVMPSRITARFSTHHFLPSDGYKREFIGTEDPVVTVNHYRRCYPGMKTICSGRLTEDKYILKFVERFRNRTCYTNE